MRWHLSMVWGSLEGAGGVRLGEVPSGVVSDVSAGGCPPAVAGGNVGVAAGAGLYPGLVPTDMGMKLAGDVVTAGLFPTPEEAVGAIIEQTPLGRLGTVSDMADAVVFLCSDASRFITGAGLPVDGGMGT